MFNREMLLSVNNTITSSTAMLVKYLRVLDYSTGVADYWYMID